MQNLEMVTYFAVLHVWAICKILRKSPLAFRISGREYPRMYILEITKCTTFMTCQIKAANLQSSWSMGSNARGRTFEGERTLKETRSDSFE